MVVVWMGNRAGCEPGGMGVMGNGGQQSPTGLVGSGVEDDLWGGVTWDV